MGADRTHRYAADDVANFVTSAFEALRVPENDARSVAELMVRADLFGYDTHGSFRLRQYVNRLRDGGTNPTATITVPLNNDATAIVDGDNGLGHLAMRRASEIAINKATANGIGWVGVRNGNHAGPASIYISMMVEKDLIGLYGAVGSANHVPPFGGMEKLLGTNPIAIGVPAGSAEPFILDMATTTAAAGKIKTLEQRGEQMPEGWMVARDGQPLTDPSRRDEGFLLPIGGAKGYGLALAVGLLAGTLNGAALGRDVVEFSKETAKPTNTGQFIAAISVASFGDVEAFKSRADAVFQQLRDSAPLPGTTEVRIPGQNRNATCRERLSQGIPLHPNLVETLSGIAHELDIAPLG